MIEKVIKVLPMSIISFFIFDVCFSIAAPKWCWSLCGRTVDGFCAVEELLEL